MSAAANVYFKIVDCIADGYVHPSEQSEKPYYAPCRIYVVTLCHISKDSELLVDYGGSYDKRHL